MRKVKIITDSCADLSAAHLRKYDIDYVKMRTVEDGKEAPALLTWTEEDVHRLYNTIRGGKRILTTQVPVEEFTEVFSKYLEEGYDIVYVACSLKLSGSVNTGHVTAQKLLKDYPEAKIFCIDSMNASLGEGMLAIEAAKIAGEGKDATEIASYIDLIRRNVHEYVTVHTLDHLKKAGRVSASTAFLGNLMGVKPILIADANGEQAAYKKVKGRKKSMEEIVNLLKDNITDSKEQTIYVAHADCNKDEIQYVMQLIRENIPCKHISVGPIGPIVGASIGPDAIGVWGYGEPVIFKAQ